MSERRDYWTWRDDYPERIEQQLAGQAGAEGLAVVIPSGDADRVLSAIREAGIPVYANAFHSDTDVLMGEDWADCAVAFRCQHCGRPAYYDPADEAYHHAARPWRGCFLIPPEEDRGEDVTHPLMAGAWSTPDPEDVDYPSQPFAYHADLPDADGCEVCGVNMLGAVLAQVEDLTQREALEVLQEAIDQVRAWTDREAES